MQVKDAGSTLLCLQLPLAGPQPPAPVHEVAPEVPSREHAHPLPLRPLLVLSFQNKQVP